MIPRSGNHMALGTQLNSSMGLPMMQIPPDMLQGRGLGTLPMAPLLAPSVGMRPMMAPQSAMLNPVPQNSKLNKIWIKHLPLSATIVQLGVYFSSFGKVIDCEIIKDAHGRNTGVGYICYDSEETAQREVVKQHMFQGQKLVLEPAYRFEASPEFGDIINGKLTFPPLGKAAFAGEDDFELHISDGKSKAKPKLDERAALPSRRVEPGPPIFGVARPLEPPRPVIDAGAFGRSVPMGAALAPGQGTPTMTMAPPAMQRPAGNSMMGPGMPLPAMAPSGLVGLTDMHLARDPSPNHLRRDDLQEYRRDAPTVLQSRRPGEGFEPVRRTQEEVPGQVAQTALVPPPVRLDTASLPTASPPATVPIRPQAASSSSLYGSKVIMKPTPEVPLQGDNLKSVYVSNLAWWATDEDIRGLVVEIVGMGTPFNVIFDEHKPNGKSLGSVFIDVQTDQLAQLVIRGLNGRIMNRRELKAELFGQPSDTAEDGDAGRPSVQGHTTTSTAEKRKTVDDDESSKKRPRSEPTEICKWHLEGGCKYGAACPLLHPDLSQRKALELKASSRSDKKGKEERRTHRSQKDDKKDKAARKDGERQSGKHDRPSSGTRHRHRPQEDSEEDSGSEETDTRGKRRK